MKTSIIFPIMLSVFSRKYYGIERSPYKMVYRFLLHYRRKLKLPIYHRCPSARAALRYNH